MTKTTIAKGGNAALQLGPVNLEVAARGAAVDVSALLLGANGKVRTDRDLVFYNNPTHDGVSVIDHTINAHLPKIPNDVTGVVIVVSVDTALRATTFTTAPQLTVTQPGAATLRFAPPNFTSGETVVVLAELYRRNEAWKIRAVGQGYASGLAGLATDYGVDVDDEPASPPAQQNQISASIELTKVAQRAPALLSTARQAGQALTQSGIAGSRAAVYLVLDHSYVSQELYESFAIQAFAERILALSANLDDDGVVPVVFASGDEPFLEEISLDNYKGRIGQLHTQVDWGWRDAVEAMRCVVNHYQASGATDPAFVVVHVSDEPQDKSDLRTLLQNTAPLGLFWLFVGFGRGKLAFYKNLNSSASAKFANVAFYDAGKNPGSVPGEQFFTRLTDAFGAWLST